jgi:hypothetical protein
MYLEPKLFLLLVFYRDTSSIIKILIVFYMNACIYISTWGKTISVQNPGISYGLLLRFCSDVICWTEIPVCAGDQLMGFF